MMDVDRIWGFLSPATRARIEEQERESAKRLFKAHGQKWDPLKTKFEERIALDGDHYNEWLKPFRIFDTKPVKLFGRKEVRNAVRTSPAGKWGYSNRILPEWTWLETRQGHRNGKVVFNKPVVIPTLSMLPSATTMASCTPMEMFTQRQGYRLATGTVLIGGLGLGMFLRIVAAKKSVKHIIVVEVSEDLLDWYGHKLCEEIERDTSTPIDVICDDVWKHVGQHGADTRHLLDIWEGYPTYMYELAKEHAKLAREVKYFWGWGLLADPNDY